MVHKIINLNNILNRWGRPDQRKYGSASTSDPRLNNILYDDYGRMHTFEFDLPRGLYDVTVSVGWNGRTYKNNTISVNGVEFFNVEPTNVSVPYMNRTRQVMLFINRYLIFIINFIIIFFQKVYCYSNKLFLEIGDAKDYTMLNFMIIKLNTTNIGFNYFPQQPLLNQTTVNSFGKKLDAIEKDISNRGYSSEKNQRIYDWIHGLKNKNSEENSDRK